MPRVRSGWLGSARSSASVSRTTREPKSLLFRLPSPIIDVLLISYPNLRRSTLFLILCAVRDLTLRRIMQLC